MQDDTASKIAEEEARDRLSDLLDDAERGKSSIITRRGQPVAALVPIDAFQIPPPKQLSLLPLQGTGRGLWGKNSTRTIRALKDEWER